MQSYASVVTYSVQPLMAEQLHQAVEDHIIPAAQGLSGYRGFLLLDQGEGKRMGIVIFDSLEAAQAAPAALTPIGEKYTYALMSGPAIGALYPVLSADGRFD